MVVNSDFPAGNFDVAKNVRQQQKRKWEESDTNKESTNLKNKTPRVKFDKVSMFLSACSSGDLDEAKQLLNYGLDINSANPDGLTALHQACIYDKLEVVEFLLENGADINCTDPEGWTPLHCAAYCGYGDITKILIEKKANLSSLNSNCELPLDLALDKPDIYGLVLSAMQNLKIDADSAKKSEETRLIEDARSWLRDGVRPSFRHPGSGATPLHVAAAKGYLEAIQLLLDAGADIEARDNDEWTPLMAAAHWSQIGACELLLQAGANAEISSRLGYMLEDVVADDIRSDLQHLMTEYEGKRKTATAPDLASKVAAKNNPAAPVPGVDESSYESGSEVEENKNGVDEQKQNLVNKAGGDSREILSLNNENNAAIPNVSSTVLSQNQTQNTTTPGVAAFSIGEPIKAVPINVVSTPTTTDENARANLPSMSNRGTIVTVEEQQGERKPSVSSSVSSSSDESHSLLSSSTVQTNGTSRTNANFRPPLALGGNSLQTVAPPRNAGSGLSNGNGNRQVAVPPIATSPVPNFPNIVGRARPVSANLTRGTSSSNDTSAFLTSTPKLSSTTTTASAQNSNNVINSNHNNNSSSNNNNNNNNNSKTPSLDNDNNNSTAIKMLQFTSNSQLSAAGNGIGPGITRVLAEELSKAAPSTPNVDLSSSSSSSSPSSARSSPSPPSPPSLMTQQQQQQLQQGVGLRRPVAPRPLSTLVASEDGAASRIQQSNSTRSVPVFAMVHRSGSATSNSSTRHAPVIAPTPASPHPSRYGLTTTALPVTTVLPPSFGSSHSSSILNGSSSSLNTTATTTTTTNSNNYASSRLRTPPYRQVMSQSATSLTVPKQDSYQRSSDDLPTTATGMVAVLATPVTAVTPQHSTASTPSTSITTVTPTSSTSGSANRSATDEAEAERKARARHNRQTRRATQGVTLEEFAQAKNMATTDGQLPQQPVQSVVATAAPVTTTLGLAPSGGVTSSSSITNNNTNNNKALSTSLTQPFAATPVIGTVSPITQITPSVVYASSAMASSTQGGLTSSRYGTSNGGQSAISSSSVLPAASVSANNATTNNNNNSNLSSQSLSQNSSATNASSSSRRRAPPRRSTGISQADVSEAAENLASTNNNNNETTTNNNTSAGGGGGAIAASSSSSQQQSASLVADNVPTTTNSNSIVTSSQALGAASATSTRRGVDQQQQPTSSSTSKTNDVVTSQQSGSSTSSTGTSSFLVEYDRLYELERAENERLKTQGRQMSAQMTELQRDKRSLQRRVSELEEETRELERLRAENQRLKDENCALIRVISKLSK